MKFEYFNGKETASNCYFIIPKALQTDPELRKLSVYAKYLYGLMLDRRLPIQTSSQRSITGGNLKEI